MANKKYYLSKFEIAEECFWEPALFFLSTKSTSASLPLPMQVALRFPGFRPFEFMSKTWVQYTYDKTHAIFIIEVSHEWGVYKHTFITVDCEENIFWKLNINEDKKVPWNLDYDRNLMKMEICLLIPCLLLEFTTAIISKESLGLH